MNITTIKPEASESKKIISILPYGTALHHHHFDAQLPASYNLWTALTDVQ